MQNASGTFNHSRSLDLRRPIITVITAAMKIWLRRARTRRHLCNLDARRLHDVGISKQARERECAKWFWQR
jgi:uncharacterized protein YjiS (DUF1127 family)